MIAYAFWVGGPVFGWIGIGAVILALGAYLFSRVVRRLYLGAVEREHDNRRLLAELKLEQARAVQAHRDKQQFFSAASHDPRHLERVLSNLVINAIEHMGRPGSILIGLRRGPGQALRIEVLDDGQGIPAAHQGRVFDELHQVQNPERNRAGGVGLGLAIVKRLCALLDGRVTLRASPGRGCRFTLTFDQPETEPAPAPAPEPAPPVAAIDTAMPAAGGAAVLILEDDAQLARALGLQLTAWGFTTRTAHDPDSALAAIDGFQPRLALADLQLRGGETAPAVLAALARRLGRPLPALLLTGRVDADPPPGADGQPLLLKPVAPERLRAALLARLRDVAPDRQD